MIKILGAAEITVVDKNRSRADYAGTSGAKKVYYDIKKKQSDYFDVVVDATGILPVMSKTLDFVRY